MSTVMADMQCRMNIDDLEAVLAGERASCTARVVLDQSTGVVTSGLAAPRRAVADPEVGVFELDAETVDDLVSGRFHVATAEHGTVGFSVIAPCSFEESGRGHVADVAHWQPGRVLGEQAIERHDMFTTMAQMREEIRASEYVTEDNYLDTVRDTLDGATLMSLASQYGVSVTPELQRHMRTFGEMVTKEAAGFAPQREAELTPGTVAYKVAAYQDAMRDGQRYAFKPGGMDF